MLDSAVPIYWISLIAFLISTLIIIILINFLTLKIKIAKHLIISFFRMSIQLSFAGIYLKWIFNLNNSWINFTWLFIMITTASVSTIKNSNLKIKYFFIQLIISIALPLFITLSIMLIGIIRPTPIFSARYIIPMGGMLLGNSLNSNIITLRTFFNSIKTNQSEFHQRLLLGANKYEAASPWIKQAAQNAVSPTLASMASMGIVSLPGMVTGQLLQGANPNSAIRYQIIIMVGIFFVQFLSVLFTLLFSMIIQFDKRDRLKLEIFSSNN